MPNNAKAIVVHVKSQSSVGTAATITPGSDEALRVIGRPTFTVRGEGAIERLRALAERYVSHLAATPGVDLADLACATTRGRGASS